MTISGKDYLNGIKAGLGDKAATMIVAEASYETSDPTIDLQILKIKAAGADLFFSASTPKFAAQAIKKNAELDWHPVHILDINATSVGAVMQPAGLAASKGVISVNYGKDPLDPTWKDDAGMKRYFDFMAKYYPEGDKNSSFNTYGYSTTQLLIPCSEAVRRRPDPGERAEAGHQSEERAARPGAAGNRRQHHAERLPGQQAASDDEVQWRTLGTVRPDSGRCRRDGLNRAPSANLTSSGFSKLPHARACPGHARSAGMRCGNSAQ